MPRLLPHIWIHFKDVTLLPGLILCYAVSLFYQFSCKCWEFMTKSWAEKVKPPFFLNKWKVFYWKIFWVKRFEYFKGLANIPPSSIRSSIELRFERVSSDASKKVIKFLSTTLWLLWSERIHHSRELHSEIALRGNVSLEIITLISSERNLNIHCLKEDMLRCLLSWGLS